MRVCFFLGVFGSFLSCAADCSLVFAQCRWPEIEKLTASDTALDKFGHSVSISGDVAVVGAYLDDDAATDSGSAYVYRFNGSTWDEEQELTASDGELLDLFGYSVSISGGVVVVGAYGDDDGGQASGSAYVYRFDGTTWLEEQKLTASDAAANDSFGISVSISGDVVVLGAIGDGDAGFHSGSAYVYRFNGSTWDEERKLTASDAAALEFFGRSVSISGDVVVVGAYGDDDGGSNSGAAYVYRFNGSTWEEQKLTASDAAANDVFGFSVSVSEDTVVVGAFHDDDACPGDPLCESGSAYVYRFNGSTWDEEQKLTASDAAAEDWFGFSVSISGDVVVVGAFMDEDGGVDSGSAYVYRFNGSTWDEEQKLTASDAAANDSFGYSVSISGDVAVVGAPGVDGSAYVFELGCEFIRGDCNGDGSIDIADPICNLDYLFQMGPSLCLDAQDTNDDGAVNIADPIYNLGYQFSMGPAPPAPFPNCGVDQTEDEVECGEYSCP